MAGRSMDVKFQPNTPEAIAAFRRLLTRRERKHRLLLLVLYAALADIPPSLFFWVRGNPGAVIGCQLAMLVSLLTVALVSRRATGQLLNSFQQKEYGPCRVEISPTLFLCEHELGWDRRAWSKVLAVDELDGHIMLFFDRTTAQLVPCSAFSSADEARRFAALAEQYRQEAAHGNPQLEASHEPEIESVAARVSFETSPADRLAVMHNLAEQKLPGEGSRAPARSTLGQRRLTVLLAILFCLWLFIVIARNPRQETYTAQMLRGGSVFIVWGMLMLAAVRRVRQWWARRSAKRNAPELATAIMTAEGVHTTMPGLAYFNRWQHWEDIRTTSNYILFCVVKNYATLIIPKRAFDDVAAADHFFELASSYRDATGRPAVESAQLTSRPDSDNPYQAPENG